MESRTLEMFIGNKLVTDNTEKAVNFLCGLGFEKGVCVSEFLCVIEEQVKRVCGTWVTLGREYLPEEEFIRKVEEEMRSEEFTKSDLVVGKHIVETKEGGRYLYLGDDFVGAKVYMSVKGHKEDLTYTNSALTVVKVYEYSSGNSMWALLESGQRLKLVWERTEKSQSQTEYEELQSQIKKLQEQANKLGKTIQ